MLILLQQHQNRKKLDNDINDLFGDDLQDEFIDDDDLLPQQSVNKKPPPPYPGTPSGNLRIL